MIVYLYLCSRNKISRRLFSYQNSTLILDSPKERVSELPYQENSTKITRLCLKIKMDFNEKHNPYYFISCNNFIAG